MRFSSFVCRYRAWTTSSSRNSWRRAPGTGSADRRARTRRRAVAGPVVYAALSHAGRPARVRPAGVCAVAASRAARPACPNAERRTLKVAPFCNYRSGGRPRAWARALGVVDKLADLARRSYVSPMSFAIVYQGLGDAERWREMMQAALDERNGFLPLLDAPWSDPMRDDPFFAELRRKVGLPERPTELEHEPRTKNPEV